MKKILRYLKATIDLGRTLKKSSNLTLIGYSYIGWGNDLIQNNQRLGSTYISGVMWCSSVPKSNMISKSQAQ